MENRQRKQIKIAPRDAKMIVFGDALSDTGNLFDATDQIIPPSPPYFEGRLSNGILAVEQLAESLGLTLTDRTNFAIAGATTGKDNIVDVGRFRFGGLQTQIDQFSKTIGSRRFNPKALYVVWAGWDDLLSRSRDRIVSAKRAADNIETAVTTLAELGARNILVVQNPNLGRTPFGLESKRFRSLTEITRIFNQRLESALAALDPKADLNLILSDLFSVGEAIAQDPSKFGLSNVVSSYLRPLRPRDPSVDPDKFLYWDIARPTRIGHQIFAEQFRADILENIEDDLNRIGTELKDRLIGFAGDDRLDGLGGRDVLEGNGGRDFLLGGRGQDFLTGQRDDDTLLGEFGSDRLFGGDGRDRLIGGSDVDFLSGGLGDDLLKGGGKCDFFSVRLRGGTDTIQDFKPGTDLLLLGDRLKEARLDIRQQGKDALIAIARTDRIIAILENVKARAIGARDFLDGRIDNDLLELANLKEGAPIFNAIEAELSGLQHLVHTF